jgi:protein involved in polysaccharide export with SLBB domain
LQAKISKILIKFQNMNKLKRYLNIVLFIIAFLSYYSTNAQVLNFQNLATVKVNELSDDQIADFWNKAQAKGLSINQLEQEAAKRKMPSGEFAKLKSRIANLPANNNLTTNNQGIRSKTENNSEASAQDLVFSEIKPKIFGAELFNNKSLTFEPNLKIATPSNYQLGPDDELIIDIYGFSEETFNLKISPDGNIRIPSVGPIQLSGLTIEQARKKIIQNLTKVYDRINTGETNVSITLGNIRSIKVLIVGEANLPGTYTLPSLATVFNALYVSGGPNKNGSMRNIKVIRNNKTIATLDIYDFLTKGEAKGNIRLQDQDIIKINTYENRVELTGEVKRNGLFEVAKGETINDVINFAGGFTDNAFTDRIKVTRNTSKQKSVADIQKELYGMFYPKSGDVYSVDILLDRFENRIQINGAVFRPGTYALEPGLTILKLIKKAEGLKEDAFLTRAIIYRLQSDNSLTMLSINLADAMQGKAEDILLQREDQIQIASKQELKETYNVSINGLVIKPGVFPYAKNMKIEDLIIAAGGFKEAASIKRVEVSRRKFDVDKMKPNSEISIIKQFDLDKDLKDNPNLSFELQPFDNVTIFMLPGYIAQKNVSIDGEILYPGNYSIEKNDERISDLIKRSGGLTATAYAEGTILLRPKNQSNTEQFIKESKLRALKKLTKDSTEIVETINDDKNSNYDLVGIDLKTILKNPGSKDDLFLREGDIIKIPIEKQTVLVSGEILYPIKLQFEKGKSLRYYVSNSGGFSSRALKKRAYVVYANGTAKATKRFMFINFYPKIKQGSEIVIPQKEEKTKVSTTEIVTVSSAITTTLVLVFTIVRSITVK